MRFVMGRCDDADASDDDSSGGGDDDDDGNAADASRNKSATLTCDDASSHKSHCGHLDIT
jgi:hypothetical protein